MLLHAENFERIPIFGQKMARDLHARADEVVAAQESHDPDVSIIIRARNEAGTLEKLLRDIETQEFTGNVQKIVVDSGSADSTRAVAHRYGAEVVPIQPDDFSYPRALNRGYEAAGNPFVFSFVGHSLLSNIHTLRTAARWADTESFAGAYGISLPGGNATRTERVGALMLGVGAFLSTPANRVNEDAMGLMASNCCVVAKAAWEDVGGYDESYGAGGEDGALAREFLRNGLSVIREPALSVFHTHGLGPVNALKQLMAWRAMSEPRPFDQTELFNRRPDLSGGDYSTE
ncbi:MAG TPA: glycosyltransferase family 2 protein [Candidatus Saccharimonadales bacterium]